MLNEKETEQVSGTSKAFIILGAKLESLHGDVSDMKSTLKELASAFTKLALIEERQTQAGQIHGRIFDTLAKIEARILALEMAAPIQRQTNGWVTDAVKALAVVALLFALKKVGLL